MENNLDYIVCKIISESKTLTFTSLFKWLHIISIFLTSLEFTVRCIFIFQIDSKENLILLKCQQKEVYSLGSHEYREFQHSINLRYLTLCTLKNNLLIYKCMILNQIMHVSEFPQNHADANNISLLCFAHVTVFMLW